MSSNYKSTSELRHRRGVYAGAPTDPFNMYVTTYSSKHGYNGKQIAKTRALKGDYRPATTGHIGFTSSGYLKNNIFSTPAIGSTVGSYAAEFKTKLHRPEEKGQPLATPLSREVFADRGEKSMPEPSNVYTTYGKGGIKSNAPSTVIPKLHITNFETSYQAFDRSQSAHKSRDIPLKEIDQFKPSSGFSTGNPSFTPYQMPYQMPRDPDELRTTAETFNAAVTQAPVKESMQDYRGGKTEAGYTRQVLPPPCDGIGTFHNFDKRPTGMSETYYATHRDNIDHMKAGTRDHLGFPRNPVHHTKLSSSFSKGHKAFTGAQNYFDSHGDMKTSYHHSHDGHTYSFAVPKETRVTVGKSKTAYDRECRGTAIPATNPALNSRLHKQLVSDKAKHEAAGTTFLLPKHSVLRNYLLPAQQQYLHPAVQRKHQTQEVTFKNHGGMVW